MLQLTPSTITEGPHASRERGELNANLQLNMAFSTECQCTTAKQKITAMSVTFATAGSFSVQVSCAVIYSSTEQVEIIAVLIWWHFTLTLDLGKWL